MESHRETNNFRPVEVNLPEQYNHFSGLSRVTKNLRAMPNYYLFEDLYSITWSVLLMHMDRTIQEKLISQLRLNLKDTPKDSHSVQIGSYWRELEKASIYPTYNRLRSEFNDQSSGARAVHSWTAEGMPLSDDYFPHGVLSKAAELYPYVFNKKLIYQMFGGPFNPGSQQYVAALMTQVAEAGGNHLLGYLSALQLQHGARRYIWERVLNLVYNFEKMYQGEIVLSFANGLEPRIRGLLGENEPFHYFSRAIDSNIHDKEGELFGDNVKVAARLWKTVVFMRTRLLSPNISPVNARRPIIDQLLAGRYDQARYAFEALISQYPGIVPKFVERQLNIQPALLREYFNQMREAAKAPSISLVSTDEEGSKARATAIALAGKILVSPDGSSIRIKFSQEANRFHVKPIRGLDSLIRSRGLNMKPQDILALIQLYNLKPEAGE